MLGYKFLPANDVVLLSSSEPRKMVWAFRASTLLFETTHQSRSYATPVKIGMNGQRVQLPGVSAVLLDAADPAKHPALLVQCSAAYTVGGQGFIYLREGIVQCRPGFRIGLAERSHQNLGGLLPGCGTKRLKVGYSLNGLIIAQSKMDLTTDEHR